MTLKKVVHLECGHAVEVSKPEAKQLLAAGTKTMGCEDCDKQTRILSIRVPKVEEPKADPRPNKNTRNYGRGNKRR